MKKNKSIFKFSASRYFIATGVFLVWITFFDQNNLIERKKLTKQIKQIEDDMVYYRKQIEIDKKRLLELKTNTDNLEKFAREQYLMKRDNEDVFVIVKE